MYWRYHGIYGRCIVGYVENVLAIYVYIYIYIYILGIVYWTQKQQNESTLCTGVFEYGVYLWLNADETVDLGTPHYQRNLQVDQP